MVRIYKKNNKYHVSGRNNHTVYDSFDEAWEASVKYLVPDNFRHKTIPSGGGS